MTVYFAQCESFVKIGVTANLKERLGALATSSPFPILCLGTLPGDAEFEGWLHRRFDAHRHSGEWFHHRGSVAAFVRECVSQKSEKRRMARLSLWRQEASCSRCGGRMRNATATPEDDPAAAFPVVVCRHCGATWEV